MLAIIKSIVYMMTLPVLPAQVSVCAYDLSHLNYKVQIELSMACNVNIHRTVYSEDYLKGLYEQR